MTIVYKHPRFASYALRLLAGEGFYDDAQRIWNAYLDDVLLPENPVAFGCPEVWR